MGSQARAAGSPRGHGVAGHPSDAARLSEVAAAAVPATGRATDRDTVPRLTGILYGKLYNKWDFIWFYGDSMGFYRDSMGY